MNREDLKLYAIIVTSIAVPFILTGFFGNFMERFQ